MKILTFIMITAGFSLAGDWPQFKCTANRQGCDLSEQVSLPSKLCCWFDFGSPIRASAAVANGKAYIVSGRGLLARIDLASNSVDWHRNLGGVNNESSPAVEDGKVYVGSTTGGFYILDAASGAPLKEYQANGAIFASPLLYNGSVYFGSADGVFHALDMDGNLKWTFQASSKPVSGSMNDGAAKILHGAAADSGLIVFPAGLGQVYWLRDSVTRADTAYVYRWPAVPNIGTNTAISTPTIWGGHVYIGLTGQEESGSLFRFRLAGSDRTSFQLGVVRTSPSIDTASEQIFFGTSAKSWGAGGGMNALGAGPNWRTSDLMGFNSSPAVINNCVIVGDENGRIYFYNKGAGNAIWSYTLSSSSAIEASPAVSGGRVVVGSLDGCLYGFWDGTEVTEPVVVDSMSTESKKGVAMPGKWTLTAFPNPASAGRVNMELAGLKEKASIAIYNISGNLIQTLTARGPGAVQWDLRDRNDRAVSSGSYYALVRNAGGKLVKTFNLRVVK